MKKQSLLFAFLMTTSISVFTSNMNNTELKVAQKTTQESAATSGNVDYLPSAGVNMIWAYQPDFSNEFDYAGGKAATEFTNNWQDRFFNGWTGPGITRYTADQSSVADGLLVFKATIEGSLIRTGCVTTKSTVVYPMYMEVRAKISESSLASAVWMLSDDSTEEIDNLEAFGGKDQSWSKVRLHLSHHTFKRDVSPILDYQPTSDATWYLDNKGTIWSDDYHNYGVLWTDPFSLAYYVDGVLVRTTPAAEIDPNNYLGGNGLTKPMHLIISAAAQAWRDIDYVNQASVQDEARSTMRVDWIRVYKPSATSAISTVEDNNKLTLYPQPFTDNVNIQSSEQIQQIQMYRTDGTLVKTEQINGQSKTIATNDLASGLYILKAKIQNGTMISKKVIKE